MNVQLPRGPWPKLATGRRTRVVQVVLYALVLLWAVAESVRALARVQIVVFHGYVTLGQVARMPYSDPYLLHLNTWPPFFLFVAIAISWVARVSEILALAGWQVLELLAIWACCKLAVELFWGDDHRVSFWPKNGTGLAFGSAAVMVPFLMTARLFQEHVQHTQINVQVLFLILAAFRLFRSGRATWGGALLAAASSLKATPVLFVPYLAYKRAWRPLAWTVAFLVLLNVVLPVAAFGPQRAWQDWREWRAVANRELADPVAEFRNQSLLGGLKRLLTESGGTLDPTNYAVADMSPGTLRVIYYGLAGAGLLALAWAFRRHPSGLAGREAAAELAICLGALTVVDPLAWKAHYVTLIVPYAFTWWAFRRLPAAAPGRRWWWALWWGSFGCLNLSAPALIGGRARNLVESFDVILIGAVLLLVLALLQLSAISRQQLALKADG